MKWPTLPETLEPGYAYGLLQIRKGARLRHSELARVNTVTGRIALQDYLSRDAYDWCDDTITFRPWKATFEVDVEEGDRTEFALDADDLPQVMEAWAKHQSNALLKIAKSQRALVAAPSAPRKAKPKF
jgi:hypothetical protein